MLLPTHLPVIADFRPPSCPYCAGQRGMEYATEAGSIVEAAAAGEVTFAGMVGGVRYVVVRTLGGALVTHGQLGKQAVAQGHIVRQGEAIGTTSDRLYIGVRVGGRYVDPRRCLAVGSRARAVLMR